MDTAADISLIVFLAGTVAAAFVAGLAGFAFGVVAAAIWLHVLQPSETTALIVAYALLVQGYAVWKLRRAIQFRRLLPLIVGSAIGIPAGIAILGLVAPGRLRVAIGALLVLFSAYNLARPKLPAVTSAGPVADGLVGVGNGVLGGATGLGGILPTIWSGLRGWSKDEQRAVYQPTAVATFAMTIFWLGGLGAITQQSIKLFLIGLPALALGTLVGWKLYGRLDEASFRTVVLVLLLLSGLVLMIRG
jgi:uncharacterized membrane protein YfcA